MFENAKWISAKVRENENGSYIFRKEFEVKAEVRKAELACVGLGYGEFSLNGGKVSDDALSTPFTRFDARVLYSTYNVTDSIREGINVLGAFIGNGWYNVCSKAWNYGTATWRHHPKFILKLDIEYENGEKQSVVSDSSWKSYVGASVYNQLRAGERYDARLELDGWNSVGFDDTNWGDTVVCRGAGGVLLPAKLPPIRIIRTLNAKYLGNNVYDFGENISGWVKIRAKGERGQKITFDYSERLDPYGNIENSSMRQFAEGELKQCDEYIMRGVESEEWEPRFTYHGFRYVKVQNAPKDFEIFARVVHTDLEIIGEFECSDDMLNKIHQAARRSTLTNFHSIPTDCPHREQNGWTGDALISCEQSLMNYDMIEAYRKWLDDFKDVQRPNGQLPGVIPTSNWGYNWGSGPAWDSAIIFIPWQVYQLVGDLSLIERMWDNMKLYMDFMDSMAEGYIVDFGLCDWAPPYKAVRCPTAASDTAFYYKNCTIMAECAELMGERSDVYLERAQKIKEAYREKFKDADLEQSQTFLAAGIYFGLYEDDEKPAFAEKLAELVKNNDYHIDCGTIGAKCIFTALSEYGYADVIYKMITNPSAPSYAFWINNGMTTLCETWPMEASLNHHMFSEVDYWFYKYVAGIRLSRDGIVIKPCLELGIDTVEARHRDIEVKIEKENIKIKVPKVAKVILKGKEYVAEEGITEFSLENL